MGPCASGDCRRIHRRRCAWRALPCGIGKASADVRRGAGSLVRTRVGAVAFAWRLANSGATAGRGRTCALCACSRTSRACRSTRRCGRGGGGGRPSSRGRGCRRSCLGPSTHVFSVRDCSRRLARIARESRRNARQDASWTTRGGTLRSSGTARSAESAGTRWCGNLASRDAGALRRELRSRPERVSEGATTRWALRRSVDLGRGCAPSSWASGESPCGAGACADTRATEPARAARAEYPGAGLSGLAMVRLSAVAKRYVVRASTVHALRGINLQVPRGSACALVGPTGSGKSTLLGIMAGLDRPSSGRICIDGRDLAHLRGRHLASFRLARIGLVFQAHKLIPVLSAAENVALPLTLLGLPSCERRRRVERMLGELRLAAVAKRRPAELSGGQQQRVGIARALVVEPALLLADEPTASLDEGGAREVLEILRLINVRSRTTLIVATHDPRLQTLASRRIQLREGQLVADSDPAPRSAGS